MDADLVDRAACAGIWKTDPALYAAFFHEHSEPERRKAKAVCATCPIRKQCLDAALENNEVFGVWGGTGRREREALRRDRR